MTVRFAIDESSWISLAGLETRVIEQALDSLVDNVLRAHDREEQVVKYSGIWDAPVQPGSVTDLLFANPSLDKDLCRRVASALSRIPDWDEGQDTELYRCAIFDSEVSAPSVCFAHQRWLSRSGTALIPVQTAGRAGQVEVHFRDETCVLHFVTNEREYVEFFRALIQHERADVKAFTQLSGSAFPDLLWADDVFEELDRFSQPFHNIRHIIADHLAVLNDHAAAIFREKLEAAPQEIETSLASAGVRASDENGKVKRNNEAVKQRTRLVLGQSRVFFWHTKLEDHRDRIHFLYDTDKDRIIVGIFTRHCNP